MSGIITAKPIVLDFDPAVFRPEAVKKAAYKFTDRCHVQIEVASAGALRVTLRAKRVLDDPEFLAGEFRNEVLDQDLRETIAAETVGVRNLLLAQAFSATSLVDPAGDTGDLETDPLGVRRR